MLRVRLQFDSATPLLESLAQRLASLETLLAPVAPVVAAAIERNFDEEGRPIPWAPLSARYTRWKARRFPGRRILERSGRLRRSIVTRVEGSALIASTDVPYAAAHQFGTHRLPARPFLVLTEDDLTAAAQALAESLDATGRRPVPSGAEGSLGTGRSL